jgi:hypothetical protein
MANDPQFNPNEMLDDPALAAILAEMGLGALNWFGQIVVKALIWYVELSGRDQKYVEQTFKYTHSLPVWAVRLGLSTFNAGVGAVCMLPPGGLAFVALAGDVYSLIEAMCRVCLGVGSSLAHRNGMDASALELQDYVDILSLWAGDVNAVQNDTVKAALTAPSGNKAATQSAHKGAKVAAHAAKAGKTVYTSAKAAKAAKTAKFAGKSASKVAAKVVAKGGGKAAAATSSTVAPGAGTALAAVGNAGLNGWIMSDISHYAEVFYKAKFGLEKPSQEFLDKLSEDE